MLLQTFDATTSWASKKQPLVADSTTYSEIMSAAFAVREALWIKKLLCDLGFPEPTCVLKVDNQAQIKYFEKESLASSALKHVDIRFQFVREQVVLGFVTQQYVPTKQQLADVFTKALALDLFNSMKSMIGIQD